MELDWGVLTNIKPKFFITEIKSNKSNEYNPDTVLNVDDIIKKNINSIETIEILRCQYTIAHFLQKVIDNEIDTNERNHFHTTINDLIKYIKWISKSSSYLCNKIGQEEKYVELNDFSIITRSSYNFCINGIQCKKFYVKDEEPTCCEHHYVHNLVKYDCDILLNFINKNLGKDKLFDNISNIYSSIKTISFVTRHMFKELYSIYDIDKNYEKYYKNNPVKIRTSRNQNQNYNNRNNRGKNRGRGNKFVQSNNRFSLLF